MWLLYELSLSLFFFGNYCYPLQLATKTIDESPSKTKKNGNNYKLIPYTCIYSIYIETKIRNCSGLVVV
jgi:hypothetical protein